MSQAAPPSELLEFIVDRINVGVFAVGRDMRVQLWNRFMAMNSGSSAEEVIGRDLFELFPDLPERWLRKKIESVFILRNFAFTSWEQRPYLFRFRHNRPVTGGVDYMQQDCTFLPIKAADGTVESVCVTVFDVTETAIYQKMMADALCSMEEMSVRDGLTGLYNRRHLEASLSQEFQRAQRYDEPLSVVLFDIDHFKQVNDSYGHQAGDQILKRVAERSLSVLRAADTAGRYGGEEFTIILPNTDLDGAEALAERLREAIGGEPIRHEDCAVAVTISAGVAAVGPDTADHERLLGAADDALYMAKKAGRNRVVARRPG